MFERKVFTHMMLHDSESVVNTTIDAEKGWLKIDLHELWEYRELLFFLAWRSVSIRYKQTVLGASWAILQPLFTMIIFTLFFGNLAHISSEGIPYPIFSFAALLPWQYFASAVSQSSDSLVGNSNLLSKVYFPRLIIPLAGILPPLVDFFIAFLVLLVMMFFYGIIPQWRILWLPTLLLLAMITALGIGLWTSAMNVKYRDIRYVVPFLIQLLMFVSPVVYPASLVPERWHLLYSLNPMVGVIEGFRWALIGTNAAPGPMIEISTMIALALLLSGFYYFLNVEKTFADVI